MRISRIMHGSFSFEKGGLKLANAAHRDPAKPSGIYL
jgi:hypothetical protein